MKKIPDHAARWWRDGPGLQRVVADLLAWELAALRPGRQIQAPSWPSSLDLRHDLAADSLELMGLATALATQLHLQQALEAPLLVRTRLADWLDAARTGLDADGSALTFRTSGSSGAPKPCTHPLAWLWQEVEALATLLPGRRRVVSLVPSHHIYGFLFTVLLPRRLGIATVCDLRGHAPATLAAHLQSGDLVIGHPDLWRAFGQGAGLLPPDVVGVTSTAPCPLDVAHAVLARGLARLLQVYGSSETAGVGWRDDPSGDYTLLPYWAHDEQSDGLVRQCPDGTRQSSALQDRLRWRDERHFLPDGRIDQAVQVGGVNVFPGYVAEVLRLHPAVLDASVRRMRPDEGGRLKAFIVPRDGAAADLQAALHDWLRERLSAAECPAAYTFGPRLPRGASGKLTDWIIDSDA
ncbi:AMP-binding protein [Massilia aurea]|uniref:AMP-binding protein n=1 Tax=Massilia aurea TaxID=373040 RepID=UPI0034622F80